MTRYKRGTVTLDGKRYGFYPDGSRFRIYDNKDTPFLQMVDEDGQTVLRVRQATEQGYAVIPVFGIGDIAYPGSMIRRARVIGGARYAMPSPADNNSSHS